MKILRQKEFGWFSFISSNSQKEKSNNNRKQWTEDEIKKNLPPQYFKWAKESTKLKILPDYECYLGATTIPLMLEELNNNAYGENIVSIMGKQPQPPRLRCFYSLRVLYNLSTKNYIFLPTDEEYSKIPESCKKVFTTWKELKESLLVYMEDCFMELIDNALGDGDKSQANKYEDCWAKQWKALEKII